MVDREISQRGEIWDARTRRLASTYEHCTKKGVGESKAATSIQMAYVHCARVCMYVTEQRLLEARACAAWRRSGLVNVLMTAEKKYKSPPLLLSALASL